MTVPNTEKVTLGSGILYLNGINVGHLKGDVEFEYELETVEFKPSNELGPVKVFKIREGASLKATLAELKMTNLRLAMGITTAQGSIAASASFPVISGSGSTCSVAVVAGASYDYMKFGGGKDTDEMCLRFTHTRPNGLTFHVILYNAVNMDGFNLAFKEEDIVLYDITFKGLTDSSRSDGDKIGVLVEQVQET